MESLLQLLFGWLKRLSRLFMRNNFSLSYGTATNFSFAFHNNQLNKRNLEQCKKYIRNLIDKSQTGELQEMVEDLPKMAAVHLHCCDLFAFDTFKLLGALGAMVFMAAMIFQLNL